MEKRVIAIGLDAADPQLLEDWMQQGKLPHMSALCEQGSYGRLATYDWYRAETPWTTFLTGVSPQKTGYWSPIKYDAEEGCIKMAYAFDFEEFPPFYAAAKDKGVTIFDMPQAPLVEGLEGEQVLAWGTHSGQTDSVSLPQELWDEISKKHGPHPLLNNDGANCYDIDSLKVQFEKLKVGIERRTNAFIDLIQSKDRAFSMTIFGEAHVAGHYYWHLGQPHPLAAAFKELDAPDLLLESFQAMDDAIGKIVEASPADATVVVFSAHGMGANVMDLPSVVFLPEMMYRFCFPGEQAIAPGEYGAEVPPPLPIKQMVEEKFATTLWRNTQDRGALLAGIKRRLPAKYFQKGENLVGKLNSLGVKLPEESGPKLQSPFELRERGSPQPYQPAAWFQEFWPEMKAFALPSFSEGYIRINLKGRDKHGIVPAEEYDALCDEITAELHQLVDARTGEKMVERVVRTRKSLSDETPKSPDADLVVVWQENSVADTIESPNIGRVGPLPYLRTGSHRAGGFIVVRSAEQLQVREGGHAVDLAPSFLKLIGEPSAPQMEGSPLL